MTIRSIPLFAMTALAAASIAAAPAHAQDAPAPAPTPSPTPAADAGNWDGQWEGGWDDQVTWSGVWSGTYTGPEQQDDYRAPAPGEEARLAPAGARAFDREPGETWREGRKRGHHRHARGYDRPGEYDRPRAQPAYPARERALWLEDCQARLLGDARRSDGPGGGVIGGVLGAVTGGLIGNRVADGGRLAGTLIGAGLGGIAGAVVGGAIDAASRRDRAGDADEAWRECEDYLARYERDMRYSHTGYDHGYGPAYGYAPVMMVPITTTYRYAPVRERVVEEWVEERVIEPAPAAAPRPRAAQPAPSKRVRVVK